MKVYRAFVINPLLEIKLETSDEEQVRFFEARFTGLHSPHERDPDSRTVVRLQEVPYIEISSARVMREITIPELCLFGEQDFVIVKENKGIKIPFLEIGRSSELDIIFEAGFPTYWLWRFLDDVLSFHFIGAGASLYHAACAKRGDCEIIIPGWGGTGKTTLVLYLLEDRSSAYMAEDHFVLKETGESYVYTDAGYIAFEERERFPAIKRKYRSPSFALGAAIARMALPLIPPKGEILEFVRRGLINVLTPKILVKLSDCIPDLQISTRRPARRIVLQLISQKTVVEPVIKPIDVDTLVERTIGGMQYEREDFRMAYYGFVYATGRRNPVIDHADARERQILRKALEKSSCYEVRIGDNWPENVDHVLHFLDRAHGILGG